MLPVNDRRLPRVNKSGAGVGRVLRGCGPNNKGLRLRVSQEQPKGQSGPIAGGFVILEVGDNMHSEVLLPLLGKATDAREVLNLIRGDRRQCVSVANVNLLVLEQHS